MKNTKNFFLNSSQSDSNIVCIIQRIMNMISSSSCTSVLYQSRTRIVISGCVCLSVLLFVQSLQPSFLSSICSSVHLSISPSVLSSIRPFIHPSVQLSHQPSVRPSFRLSVGRLTSFTIDLRLFSQIPICLRSKPTHFKSFTTWIKKKEAPIILLIKQI